MAVKDWITLHSHIDLHLSEINKYMQMVYEKRGEHSLFTILLSTTVKSNEKENQNEKDDNKNSENQ